MKYKDTISIQKKLKINVGITWTPVIPAKVGQNDRPPSHYANHSRLLDDPNIYGYRNMDNQLCFWIRRFEELGKKTFTPMSLWQRNDGYCEWKQKAWPENRPLYREEELKKKANTPALIVEGEKTLKHAEQDPYINAKYICVCFSGGAKAIHRTTLAALKDREVVLFPDNDEPGIMAMHEIAKRLIEEDITSAENISWINITDKKFPEGWDLADKIPNGHSIETIFANKKDYEDVDFEEAWEDIQKTWDERKLLEELDKLKDKYVWIESLNCMWDPILFKPIDLRIFANRYLQLTKKSPWTMDKRLLMEPGFKQVISYFTHPGMEPGVVVLKENQILDLPAGKYLNNFRPSGIVATNTRQEDVQKVLSYFKWLLTEENWTIVEQFIAMLVQYPGLKAHWVIFIQSVEGGGKGLLGLIIQSIVGKSNAYTNVKAHQLIEKHSNIIQGRQVIVLNELSFSNSRKEKNQLTNELKDLFTEPEVVINAKNKDPIRTVNFCNFLVYTNDRRALKLENTARRYVISRVKHGQDEIIKKQNELDVVNLILDLKNNPGPLLHYFKHVVKIKPKEYFTSKAPLTKDFEEMVKDTKEDIFQFLDEALEQKTWPFSNSLTHTYNGTHKVVANAYCGIMHKDDLYDRMQTNKKNIYCTRTDIEDWLKDNCIKWSNGQLTKQIKLSNGSRPRVYLLDDERGGKEGKLLSEMTETELGSYYTDNAYIPGAAESAFNPTDYFNQKFGFTLESQASISAIMEEFKTSGKLITRQEAEAIFKARRAEDREKRDKELLELSKTKPSDVLREGENETIK